MKYILVFIKGATKDFYDQKIAPGTMFEVDDFDTIEAATKYAKTLNFEDGRFIIMPFYEVEL